MRLYFGPVGECCGRTFWTWEGWLRHLDCHRYARADVPSENQETA